MGGRMKFDLNELIDPPETVWAGVEKVPVYQGQYALDALERHYNEQGIEFDREKFKHFVDERPKKSLESPAPQGRVDDYQKVYVQLTYSKNTVKVKLNASLWTLHEQFYAKAKKPPIRRLVAAYKSMGYPKEFLEGMERSHVAQVALGKRSSIEKMFKTKSTKAKKAPPKKKVKVEEEADIEEEVVEEEEEDGPPADDEGFDMEEDEADDVAEEYLSDIDED